MPTINLPAKGEADWDVKLNAAINAINAAVEAQGDALTEEIQDGIASTLVAGANISLNYDDVAGTLTISSSGGGGGVTLPIAMSDVTGLVGALSGKQATGDYATNTALTSGLSGKANSSHTHVIGDVSSLQAALDGKQAAGDYATNTALTSGLGGKANTSHTHMASQITDSTTVGRSVLTAADAAAARSAIGAGTSSLSLGTTSTTAKAGDYQPTADQVTETTNNKIMTAAERTKLSGIAAGATAVIVAATLGDASVTGAPIGSVIVVQ